MNRKKHLVVINTYNRIEDLNKTIRSINSSLPNVQICVVSKGKETRKEVRGKIKYFHKVKNIGRECHGYLWAFLKYPNYEIYTLLQDKPHEVRDSYYGEKIRIAEKLIDEKKGDFVFGIKHSITPARSQLPKRVKSHKFDLNILFGKELGINKKIWKFSPGACFTIKGDNLRERKKIIKEIYQKSLIEEFIPWEMEFVWIYFSKNPIYLSQDKRAHKINLNECSLYEEFYYIYLKVIVFISNILSKLRSSKRG